MKRVALCLFACTLGVSLASGAAPPEPVRVLSVSVPDPPPQTIGWLEAMFDAHISPAGAVEKVERLHGSEPLATLLHDHLTQWRFAPARDGNEAVSARVLVAAIYRPATLFDQGARGVPPPRSSNPRSPVPRPVWMPSPGYPPQATGDGVVVVELLVTAEGRVASATVIRPAGAAFDANSLEAARRWQFSAAAPSAPRPARAYVIFGFRQPVVTPH